MPVAAHLDALKQKHAALDRRIHEEDQHAAPDDLEIKRLKLEKLRLKEEIDRLTKPADAAAE
jgi:hypothetical protein